VLQAKGVRIGGHPRPDYNGDYTLVEEYDGFPYYKNERGKFLWHPVPVGWDDVNPIDEGVPCLECAADTMTFDDDGNEMQLGPGTEACNLCMRCPPLSIYDMESDEDYACVCQTGYVGEIVWMEKTFEYAGRCEATPHDQWFLSRAFDPDSIDRNAWLQMPGGKIPAGMHHWMHNDGFGIHEYVIVTTVL
jgi:hypothetical protein